jgi:hypothetical protein
MNESFKIRVRGFCERHFSAVVEVNRRYAAPRIKVTPLVSFSLLLLRIYLLLLVGILFYKFYTLVR